MNKLMLISLSVFSLTACEDKKIYEQAVLEQLQKEQDIKDYKIDPERMTRCIVETSAAEMPGAFVFDPKRMATYRNYAKMLNLTKSQDPKKTLEELRQDFGGVKEVNEARANYNESFQSCYTAMVSESESDSKEPEKKK